MSHILLVSDIAPTSYFPGGIVLEQIIQNLQNSRIDLRILVDFGIYDYRLSKSINFGDVSWFVKPNENWRNIPYPFNQIGEKSAKRETSEIASLILRDISRHRPDHLILVIQGQTSIRIALELINTGIPYTCIHWDPLSWWLKERSVPSKFSQEIVDAYSRINSSGFHLVPSPSFANHYGISKERFISIYPSMGEQVTKRVLNHDIIKVVLIGQMYAQRQVDYFFSRLNEIDSKFQGKQIEIHYFGKTTSFKDPNVIQHGWIDYKALPELISEFDFALLPYPNFEEVPDASSVSFPSKLVTYLCANIPVMYMGPTKASVDSIVNLCGVKLNDGYNSQDLILAIKKLTDNRILFQENGKSVYSNMFSSSAQKKMINQWIKLSSLSNDFAVGRNNFPSKKIRSYRRNAINRKYFSILINRILRIKRKKIVKRLRLEFKNYLSKVL